MAKLYVSLILVCFLIYTVSAQVDNRPAWGLDVAADSNAAELNRHPRGRRCISPSHLDKALHAAESDALNLESISRCPRGRRAITDLLNKFQGEHKYQSETNKDKFGQIFFNKDKSQKQPQTTPSSPTTPNIPEPQPELST